MTNHHLAQEQLQQGIAQRVHQTKAQRIEVAQHYADGDYVMLAGPAKSIQRLNARGQSQQALRLAELSVQLAQPRGASGVGLEASSSLAESNHIIYESVIGSNNMLSIQFLHRGSQVARSIGRIVTLPGFGINGTGFLISSRLFMTNHHVLMDEEDALGNLVQFEFGDTPDGIPIPFRFRPDEFFRTSPVEGLDCTVVAVEALNEAQVPLGSFGWCPLSRDGNSVQIGEQVNIIHHPAGARKQVSLRDNFVTNEVPEDNPKYWLYASDTQRGSSGSPVFDEEWQVVALHHASLLVDDPDEVDAYRRILQAYGVAGLDSADETIALNEGVRMHLILDWLESESNDFSAQEVSLYQEVVEGRLPQLLQGTNVAKIDREQSRLNVVTAEPGSSGDVLSVPLTLNIYLGNRDTAGEQTPLRPQQRLPSSEQRTLELYKNRVDHQQSVFSALSFLQTHRESAYLPTQQAIRERQIDYYGELIDRVAGNQIDATELYNELHRLSNSALEIVDRFPESMRDLDGLVGTHRDFESFVILESDAAYARARAHLYTKVDLQPHRMLQCPYTEALIAPEQLLLLDLIKELGQFDLLPQRYRNNRFLNCEHIVPQSWFKDEFPAGVSDLHHLIAADGGANLFRSNCPYRALKGKGMLGPENNPSYIAKAGHKHGGTFEPANGKHILARATLYFLITYKGAIDSTQYDPEAIEVLKQWSREKDPSDYEKHRNESAFEAQGNRNPLIDFPEWVDKIDFSEGIV